MKNLVFTRSTTIWREYTNISEQKDGVKSFKSLKFKSLTSPLCQHPIFKILLCIYCKTKRKDQSCFLPLLLYLLFATSLLIMEEWNCFVFLFCNLWDGNFLIQLLPNSSPGFSPRIMLIFGLCPVCSLWLPFLFESDAKGTYLSSFQLLPNSSPPVLLNSCFSSIRVSSSICVFSSIHFSPGPCLVLWYFKPWPSS